MDIPDEVLRRIQFSVPWQYNPSDESYKDPDDFPLRSSGGPKDEYALTVEKLQEECWVKFHQNPQVNTSVRGTTGRLCGWGFETTSEVEQIQEAIEEIELDWRNRLYEMWPKFVGRRYVEGELFLALTCHVDGFIEIDFNDPSCIGKGSTGTDGKGILYHPTKSTLPLFYSVSNESALFSEQIPSIYLARDPALYEIAAKTTFFSEKLQKNSKDRHKIFKKFNSFNRFMLFWNSGFLTKRAISHLRTVLEWLNHYENLKKYEIDHKKSSGAYVWVITMEDPKTFRIWLSLSDEDRKKTGIMAKKTPGGTLVLPPGMKLEAINPSLTAIREQDTDIMQMAVSGLNEPADVTLGTAKGTFASVKASRGPMSDRVSDEIAYFDRWLRYDFWGSIFFLKQQIAGFPEWFKVRECVGFNSEQEPIFKTVKRRPEQLLDISYPVSEIIDFESRAKGLLGVKHGPISETLGVPLSEVAKRLGIGGYGRQRLRYETEKNKYPELVYTLDAESIQEQTEAEPKRSSVKKKQQQKKEGGE